MGKGTTLMFLLCSSSRGDQAGYPAPQGRPLTGRQAGVALTFAFVGPVRKADYFQTALGAALTRTPIGPTLNVGFRPEPPFATSPVNDCKVPSSVDRFFAKLHGRASVSRNARWTSCLTSRPCFSLGGRIIPSFPAEIRRWHACVRRAEGPEKLLGTVGRCGRASDRHRQAETRPRRGSVARRRSASVTDAAAIERGRAGGAAPV